MPEEKVTWQKRLREWENEFTELSEKAQEETRKVGNEIRMKYDEPMEKLQYKIDEAKEKLKELI